MEHLCFNSRPHEEVDTKQSTARGRNCVSTHDLTKRSTFTIPSKGLLIACFNSRPHEEVDDSNMRGKQGALNVSTHDLTKRSTVYQEAQKELKEFQLTTSRRGRLIGDILQQLVPRFNSRPHEEVDHYFPESSQLSVCFNSRPHEEVDSNFYAKSFPFKITFCAHCI